MEPFRPTSFRNRVPLLPQRKISEPVTLELVKQLLDAEDEEILRAYREMAMEEDGEAKALEWAEAVV